MNIKNILICLLVLNARLFSAAESDSALSWSDAASENIESISSAVGAKKYQCAYEGCGKIFTQKSNLNAHIRIHTGEKPFKCEIVGCDRSHAKNEHLKIHMRTHTGEKPYQCEFEGCDKSFAVESNLKKHERIHIGKPYRKRVKCTYPGCNKTCADNRTLKDHGNIHEGKRPYKCANEGCGFDSAWSRDLVKHQRSCSQLSIATNNDIKKLLSQASILSSSSSSFSSSAAASELLRLGSAGQGKRKVDQEVQVKLESEDEDLLASGASKKQKKESDLVWSING